jgi:hypothetical protein
MMPQFVHTMRGPNAGNGMVSAKGVDEEHRDLYQSPRTAARRTKAATTIQNAYALTKGINMKIPTTANPTITSDID